MSATGGTATPVTTVDAADERSHRWPWFLPDGRHFLYVATSPVSTMPTTAYIGSLDSTEFTALQWGQMISSQSIIGALSSWPSIVRNDPSMADRLRGQQAAHVTSCHTWNERVLNKRC